MRSNDPLALLNRLAQWLGLCRLGGGFWRRRAPLHLRKRRRNDSTSRPLPRKDDPPPEPAASRQSASFLSLSLSLPPLFISLGVRVCCGLAATVFQRINKADISLRALSRQTFIHLFFFFRSSLGTFLSLTSSPLSPPTPLLNQWISPVARLWNKKKVNTDTIW